MFHHYEPDLSFIQPLALNLKPSAYKQATFFCHFEGLFHFLIVLNVSQKRKFLKTPIRNQKYTFGFQISSHITYCYISLLLTAYIDCVHPRTYLHETLHCFFNDTGIVYIYMVNDVLKMKCEPFLLFLITHLSLNQTASILQVTFWNEHSRTKIIVFWLKFNKGLFYGSN